MLFRSHDAQTASEEALQQDDACLSSIHPDRALTLRTRAYVNLSLGNWLEANQELEKAIAIENRILPFVLSISSRSTRLGYVHSIGETLDAYIACTLTQPSASIGSLTKACAWISCRKALWFEACAGFGESSVLERYPELTDSIRRFFQLSRQIGAKFLTGPTTDNLSSFQEMLDNWCVQWENSQIGRAHV